MGGAVMVPDELVELAERLHRGEIASDWLSGLAGADPNTVLIVLWAGRLSRRVDAFYHEALGPLGLKYSDYAVLSLLRFSGALSPKRLNASLAITSGGLTKTIQRLERKGLVLRNPDPEDGRGTLLSLTKSGERAAARLFEDDIRAHEALLAGRSSADRKRIARALRDLLDAFEGAP